MPAKIAVLANTPTKPDEHLTKNVQEDALLASTQIAPVFLWTLNVHFVPPGNGPVNPVSPPTNHVFFVPPENFPLKPVGRRTTNA